MWLWMVVAAFAGRREEKAAELAEQALAGGEAFAVLKLANKAIRKDPNNVDAHFARALTLERIAIASPPELAALMRAVARQEWEIVVALAPPDHPKGAIARDALEAESEPLSVPEPDCSEPARKAYAEAESYLQHGDMASAREAYSRALQGCPDNPVWWVHAGDAWFNDDPAQALERYDRGIALYPCHWQGLRFRADALVRLGQIDEAFSALTRAVACNPGYQAGWSDAAAVTQMTNGTALRDRPLTPPSSAEDAQAAGPAWAAWWDHRQQHGVTSLSDAVAAVRAGLAAAEPQEEWALLATLEGQGALEPAVLLLLFEPALVEELQRRNQEDPDALPRFLREHLLLR